MMILVVVIYILGAGLLNRFRGNGGAWGPDWPHSVKRVIVSVWLALVFLSVVDPSSWGLWVLILMIWIIGYTPGWGAYFDMSDDQLGQEVGWIDWLISKAGLSGVHADLLGMSLRGLHFTVPVSAYLTLMHGGAATFWLAPVGLLMGPVYYGMLLLRNAQDRIRFEYIAWSEYAWGCVLASIYTGMLAVL